MVLHSTVQHDHHVSPLPSSLPSELTSFLPFSCLVAVVFRAFLLPASFSPALPPLPPCPIPFLAPFLPFSCPPALFPFPSLPFLSVRFHAFPPAFHSDCSSASSFPSFPASFPAFHSDLFPSLPPASALPADLPPPLVSRPLPFLAPSQPFVCPPFHFLPSISLPFLAFFLPALFSSFSFLFLFTSLPLPPHSDLSFSYTAPLPSVSLLPSIFPASFPTFQSSLFLSCFRLGLLLPSLTTPPSCFSLSLLPSFAPSLLPSFLPFFSLSLLPSLLPLAFLPSSLPPFHPITQPPREKPVSGLPLRHGAMTLLPTQHTTADCRELKQEKSLISRSAFHFRAFVSSGVRINERRVKTIVARHRSIRRAVQHDTR